MTTFEKLALDFFRNFAKSKFDCSFEVAEAFYNCADKQMQDSRKFEQEAKELQVKAKNLESVPEGESVRHDEIIKILKRVIQCQEKAKQKKDEAERTYETARKEWEKVVRAMKRQ